MARALYSIRAELRGSARYFHEGHEAPGPALVERQAGLDVRHGEELAGQRPAAAARPGAAVTHALL